MSDGVDLPAVLSSWWIPLRHHPVQRYVLENRRNYQFVCIPAGRRSGKTMLAKRHTVMEAFTPFNYVGQYRHDARFFLGAPTQDQAIHLFWEDLLKAIPPPLRKGRPSYQHHYIDTVVGSRVQVIGFDKPQRMEGRPWDGGVLDEYADMRADVVDAHVLPALADRDGWLWLIGVPEGRNHFWDKWQEAQTSTDWLTATWKSETVLTAKQIALLRRNLDPRTFRQEMEASFEELQGRIYYAFDRAKHMHEFTAPAGVGQGDLMMRFGMDFNVNPMTAVVGWQQGAHLYIRHEYVVPGSSTFEVADMMKADGFKGARGYPDPAGAARKTSSNTTDHKILKNAGFEVYAKRVAPTRRDRYNAVNAKFFRDEVHIHPSCKNLIKSLEGQVYPDGRSEEDPRDPLGHANAALGYWIDFEWPIRHALEFAETGRF